jgi:predicted metal-binding membrane protein
MQMLVKGGTGLGIISVVRERRSAWLIIYGAILLAWTLLLPMAAEQADLANGYERSLLASICNVSVSEAGYFAAVLMWMLMAIAMMLPTAVPAFNVYADLGHAGHNGSLLHLALGYISVWFGFSILAAGAQVALLSRALIDDAGTSLSLPLSAGLLALAGLYQFTPLKTNCAERCRHPLGFFFEHAHEGPFRNGVRLGLVCLGCCWALMALAFVGGVMSIGFMALGALLMTLEKLPDIGKHVTWSLGLTLLVAAVWVSATAF